MPAPKPAPAPKDEAQQKFGVLVTGKNTAALKRFLARYVKPAFGMQKNQWRVSYRERYALVVLSTPLRAGQTPEAAYGRHAGAGALVLSCLAQEVAGSGRGATRQWLRDNGFDTVVELDLDHKAPESGLIDQGAMVVNYVNGRCPWRVEPIEDIDAYMAKNNKPFWA